jgi:hypothetical protein
MSNQMLRLSPWVECSRRWETETRYYATFAHPDLFGEWVLHKQWGGKGTRLGGTRVVAVGTASIAQAMAVIERQRARAGYALVERPVKSLIIRHS